MPEPILPFFLSPACASLTLICDAYLQIQNGFRADGVLVMELRHNDGEIPG